MSPADSRHPPAPPPRCSYNQAEACCAARLIGPRGAPRSWHIDQCQLRVTRERHGVRCKAIHIMGFGARRFCSLEPSCRKWSGAAAGHHGRVAQWPGPIRAPDSGDDTSFWVVAPVPHHGVYKRAGRKAASVVPAHRCCSLLLSARPELVVVSPALRSCLLVDFSSSSSSSSSASSCCRSYAPLLLALLGIWD